MDVLIVGAGAVGSYLGARLIEKGANVTFLAGDRRRDNLLRHRLTVSSLHGRFHRPVTTIAAEDIGKPADLVVFTCRAHRLKTALVQARDAIGGQTIVMTAVEGIAPLTAVRAAYPNSRHYTAVLDARLVLDADGNTVHRSPAAELAIGRLPGGSIEDAEMLVKLLDARGLTATFTPSVLDAAWHRFAFRAAGIAASVLFDLPLRDFLKTKRSRDVFNWLGHEACDIARSVGASFNGQEYARYVDGLFMESVPSDAPATIAQGGGAGAEARALLDEMVMYGNNVGPKMQFFGPALAKANDAKVTLPPRRYSFVNIDI